MSLMMLGRQIVPVSDNGSSEFKADFMPPPPAFILAVPLKTNLECIAVHYVPLWGYTMSMRKTK